MKTTSVNSRILKLEVSKDTATRTSVNAVESRTTSLESDVTTAQSDISTLQGDVATLTQGIQDAVSTHNTSPDSHADIRTLIADRALIEHQHARTDLPWITDPGAALLTAASASAQRTALGFTQWAVRPWTDGTTSDVPEGSQLYFTVDRANTCADARIAAQKGQAEGIMPLDSGGKAPLAYIPDALIGQVKFKGVWDAATNSPVLPSATASMGHYYVVSVAGSYGGIDYGVGDWCISDGTAWGKVDNSDAITSFAGRVGAILPIASDYASFYLGLSAQAADSAKFGGQLPAYYAQASHTHTFTSLTSKPTTLAGYGITDAATAGHTHSGYETAIGNPSANGYLLSSTTAGVRSWVAPYSHPAPHAQSVIDSSTGWITTALAGKQAAGSYLTTTDTAAAAKVLYDENCRRIVSPLGGELRSSVASQAGAIKIMLPAVGMDYSMMSARVCVFELATRASFEVHFQGYLYGASNTWSVYPSAYILGNPSKDRNLTLRFGYDSTQNRGVLYIGELTSQWSYPQVFVTDVQLGYAGNFTGWKSGWQIGYESAAFANVTATLTDCQVGFKTPNLTAIENLAGTAGVPVKTAANTWELKNGTTAAVVIGGTTLNFQNGVLMSVSP